jgi:DNA (cytosine-5)-methyltransferase 1
MIKFSSFCSGIGSAEQAIKNLGIEHKVVLSSEIDKYARMSYLENHDTENMINDMTQCDYVGEQYYSDLNVSGLPCQSFSLAGLRLGEKDSRGLLFYDFYRYVKNQQPKVFIIENVKGLISAEKGTIFQNWIELLGRSVNGHEKMFIHEDSLQYNLHYTVLNSKNFGVPQNRERVFIVGIRKDLPNDFRFPIGWRLQKRLRDILETNVDEKYYLSENAISRLTNNNDGYHSEIKDENDIASTILASDYKLARGMNILQVKEATKKGYDIAEPGDSINMSNPNSTTPRGRVGKGIANTLDTACNQFVFEPFCVAMRGRNPENSSDRTTGANLEQRLEANSNGTTNALTSVQKDNLIIEPLLIKFSRTENAKKHRKETGTNNFQDKQIEFVKSDIPNTITTVQKDNLIVELVQLGKSEQFAKTSNLIGFNDQEAYTIRTTESNGVKINHRIRRLTPLECFRLQSFSDDFFYKCKAVNSDTQLYRQSGNTITVSVIQAIINNLKHLL